MGRASLDQGRQILELVAQTGWTREEVQRRIIEKWGSLREVAVLLDGELTEDGLRALLSTRERIATPKAVADFASEEVPSTYGYPPGWQLLPVSEQATRLVQAFGALDVSHVVALAKGITVPDGFDGLAVIPKLSAMVRLAKKSPKKWEPVNIAMRTLVKAMKQARRDFRDYVGGNIGPEYLKLGTRTAEARAKLENLPGDCLVVPVQTGMKYRGRSVRRARFLIGENPREFGLDSVAAGILVLTHPERLQSDAVLFMDCAGTEYAPYADGRFARAPLWHFWRGVLELHFNRVGGPSERYGSVSGALPE